MKGLLFGCVMVLGVYANAFVNFDFPNMDSMINAQKTAVKTDVSVKNYVAALGGKSFKVSYNGGSLFTVKTNNSCNFNVEVVYEENFFDGIKDVVVLNRTTQCK